MHCFLTAATAVFVLILMYVFTGDVTEKIKINKKIKKGKKKSLISIRMQLSVVSVRKPPGFWSDGGKESGGSGGEVCGRKRRSGRRSGGVIFAVTGYQMLHRR